MKRDAYYALGGGIAVVLAASSAAQPTSQTPPPPVQTAPANAAANSAPVNDQSSKPAAPKEKPCAPVLIRAGPNQGQIINKCHHTDRSKTDGQSPGGDDQG